MKDKIQFPGALKDPRTEEQKAHDFKFPELYSATPIIWKEKAEKDWKSYSVRDQDGSSSCVSQGNAKALETLTGVVQSAHPIYAKRTNFPQEGMWLGDAGMILQKYGTTTEALDKSQLMNEKQMNAPVTVPTPTKIDGYGYCDQHNIDQIAQAIDLHKGVALVFHFSYAEWTDIPTVKPKQGDWLGHCVCAVDYIMYKGEKAIIIEDSWGHATSLGNGGQRIITESYLKARCDGAMYLLPHVPVTKPTYKFNTILTYGMLKNADVVALQNCMKFKGFFPTASESTGNFYEATARAVVKYQVANGVMDFANETDLKKVRVGAKTLALLNTEFK